MFTVRQDLIAATYDDRLRAAVRPGARWRWIAGHRYREDIRR